MRHWTQQERERQAQLIRSWQPWKQSTGAKTAIGKQKSGQNALKHGGRSLASIELFKRLRASLKVANDVLERSKT
jgi:hypothetical protein